MRVGVVARLYGAPADVREPFGGGCGAGAELCGGFRGAGRVRLQQRAGPYGVKRRGAEPNVRVGGERPDLLLHHSQLVDDPAEGADAFGEGRAGRGRTKAAHQVRDRSGEGEDPDQDGGAQLCALQGEPVPGEGSAVGIGVGGEQVQAGAQGLDGMRDVQGAWNAWRAVRAGGLP